MILKNLLRLMATLVIGCIFSLFWGDRPFSNDVPQMLFGVLGVLFPVSLAISVSVNLAPVKNTKYRKDFREGLRGVRHALILQFSFAVISMLPISFCEGAILQIYGYSISLNILTSFVVAFAIINSVYNFSEIQNFKDKLEDKLTEEHQQ